ncbi:hypothetical protein [Aestuariivirga litoralis]|uniref:hypothetical protein n=1 Tax=Aestuariivirga litoralis TaxID=2650924 RepID=UPI0018C4A870|nr:hypothetical protein [Aestuariivirga litoralis]MBG1231776.1 hypothetical protein [Aestuariivirga litoralis]
MRVKLLSPVFTSVLALFVVAGGAAVAQQATTTTTPDPKAGTTATAPATTPATTPEAPKTTEPPKTPDATTTAPAPAPAPDATTTAPAPDATAPATDDPNAGDENGEGDVSIGEIPDVQTVELNADMAKKAIDGYQLVHDKYQDSPLEDYSDLQDFVDKDPKGKQFETDIKSFGFTSVNEWNIAVTSVSIAYNNLLDDQTADIKQQIEDVQKSTDMAQDMKDRTIKSLQASLPSENNTKIIQDVMKDKAYGEKIKLLETTEE